LKNGTLVTPPLDDQILAGVTRDSIIQLARDVLGVTVEERPISIDEALDDGVEVFCTGTAYTVKDVASLDHRGRVQSFDDCELQQALLAELRGIQLGDREDRFDWMTEVRP
jgi:branched-chain amino acid aminotransferase